MSHRAPVITVRTVDTCGLEILQSADILRFTTEHFCLPVERSKNRTRNHSERLNVYGRLCFLLGCLLEPHTKWIKSCFYNLMDDNTFIDWVLRTRLTSANISSMPVQNRIWLRNVLWVADRRWLEVTSSGKSFQKIKILRIDLESIDPNRCPTPPLLSPASLMAQVVRTEIG